MKYDLVTIERSADKEVLSKVAKPVTFPLSEEHKALIDHMKQKVKSLNGVGLAAPQIGHSVQIIVIYISEDVQAFRKEVYETMPPTIFINPEYEAAADAEEVSDWEGCFSVETETGKVPRLSKIKYRALDEHGQIIEGTARGFTARVLQHEIDHLQGTLITDRFTENTIHGHPKDMALLRIQDMNLEEKHLMKKMIEEAIDRGENTERYDDILSVLNQELMNHRA